jgi:uncharacterized membrane protein
MGISLFSKDQQEEIKLAIKSAEFKTSGEIRVFIDTKCKEENVLDCAAYQFKQLNMHKTALRNGVLIYISMEDHRFAIIGDVGINQKVASDFWDQTKEVMLSYFKKGEITEGLKEGIHMVGDQLKALFPYLEGDKNELSDEIAH